MEMITVDKKGITAIEEGVSPSNGNPSDQQINKAAGASQHSSCQQLQFLLPPLIHGKKKKTPSRHPPSVSFFFSVSVSLFQPVSSAVTSNSSYSIKHLFPHITSPPIPPSSSVFVSPADDLFKPPPQEKMISQAAASLFHPQTARKWTLKSGSLSLSSPTCHPAPSHLKGFDCS